MEPVQIPAQLIEEDCIGKEYDPKNKECSVCAAQAFCANWYQRDIEKRIADLQKDYFLDEVDFKSVDWKGIERLADAKNKFKFSELINIVSDFSMCSDEVAVLNFIHKELPKTNLILEEGYVKRKD